MKKEIGYLRFVLLFLMTATLFVVIILAVSQREHSNEINEVREQQEKEVTREKNKTETESETETFPDMTAETIAIFGVDTRADNLGKGTRSDSIILVNVDHKAKEIRLASIFRDCYVNIEEHGMDKINHAYFYGGPEISVETINRNFDLNIEKYITVNFTNVAELVDDIGGIEMDISEAEIEYINSYIDEINYLESKNSIHITEPGTYHLDGVQTAAYTRIRYTAGGDYKRAERQQAVLFQIFAKAKVLEISEITRLVEKFMDEINTNYENNDVVDRLYYLSQYNIVDSKAFPTQLWGGKVDGVWYVLPVTFENMAKEIHGYLYPEEEYQVSETVKSVSDKIEQIADTPNEIVE